MVMRNGNMNAQQLETERKNSCTGANSNSWQRDDCHSPAVVHLDETDMVVWVHCLNLSVGTYSSEWSRHTAATCGLLKYYKHVQEQTLCSTSLSMLVFFSVWSTDKEIGFHTCTAWRARRAALLTFMLFRPQSVKYRQLSDLEQRMLGLVQSSPRSTTTALGVRPRHSWMVRATANFNGNCIRLPSDCGFPRHLLSEN